MWNSDCDAQGTAEQTVTYQDNHLMIGGRCVDVLANGTADGSVVLPRLAFATVGSQ